VKGAFNFCRRLLREVEERRRSWDLAGPDLPTLSLGVAVFPEHGSDVDELIRIADRAMYDAKAAGGNRAALSASGASFVSTRRSRKAPG
jgi:diguanylate cyclase (GGDEF)-like protein